MQRGVSYFSHRHCLALLSSGTKGGLRPADVQAGFAPRIAGPGPAGMCLSQGRIQVQLHDRAGMRLGELLPLPTCQPRRPEREPVLGEEVPGTADPWLTMHLVDLMDLSGFSVNKQHLT